MRLWKFFFAASLVLHPLNPLVFADDLLTHEFLASAIQSNADSLTPHESVYEITYADKPDARLPSVPRIYRVVWDSSSFFQCFLSGGKKENWLEVKDGGVIKWRTRATLVNLTPLEDRTVGLRNTLLAPTMALCPSPKEYIQSWLVSISSSSTIEYYDGDEQEKQIVVTHQPEGGSISEIYFSPGSGYLPIKRFARAGRDSEPFIAETASYTNRHGGWILETMEARLNQGSDVSGFLAKLVSSESLSDPPPDFVSTLPVGVKIFDVESGQTIERPRVMPDASTGAAVTIAYLALGLLSIFGLSTWVLLKKRSK